MMDGVTWRRLLDVLVEGDAGDYEAECAAYQCRGEGGGDLGLVKEWEGLMKRIGFTCEWGELDGEEGGG